MNSGVPHHLLGTADPGVEFTSRDFRSLAVRVRTTACPPRRPFFSTSSNPSQTLFFFVFFPNFLFLEHRWCIVTRTPAGGRWRYKLLHSGSFQPVPCWWLGGRNGWMLLGCFRRLDAFFLPFVVIFLLIGHRLPWSFIIFMDSGPMCACSRRFSPED